MAFIEISRWVFGTRDERGDAQDRHRRGGRVAHRRARLRVQGRPRGPGRFREDRPRGLRRGGGEMKITYLSRGIERWPNWGTFTRIGSSFGRPQTFVTVL